MVQVLTRRVLFHAARVGSSLGLAGRHYGQTVTSSGDFPDREGKRGVEAG